MAGSILLNFSADDRGYPGATIMRSHLLRPLAADIVSRLGWRHRRRDGNRGQARYYCGRGWRRTMMITMAMGPSRFPGNDTGQNLLIQGVMLDVSGADGAVTVNG